MSFRHRLLGFAALLFAGTASAAQAQRGAVRGSRPPYGYFKYRIPRVTTPQAPRIRLGDDIRLRTMERQLALHDRLRDRQFELQDRARVRQFELQDRAWRRQLEARDRAMSRMYERMDRLPKLRPFGFRRHARTI